MPEEYYRPDYWERREIYPKSLAIKVCNSASALFKA